MPLRTHLLTDDELADLHNALDVLCSCYTGSTDSPHVKDLLARYAPGTKDGKRARALFTHLRKLSRVKLSQITTPHK